jgi:hypothetical protein
MRRGAPQRLRFLLLPLLAAVGSAAGLGQELTSQELLIRGSRLLVRPAEQAASIGQGCQLATELANAGPDPAMLVVGELSGPGLDRPLRLTAPPNEPLRVPGMQVEGDYEVSGLRLERSGQVVMWAEPSRALVHVRQLLVTSVTSRALTPAELERYGIAIGQENYRTYKYSVGFAIGGSTVTYDFPVVFDELGRLLPGKPDPLAFDLPSDAAPSNIPSIETFELKQLIVPGGDNESGGGGGARVVGLIVIPTDVAFLNQFFSVLLVVQNGAPAGSPVTLRDVSAVARLPAGGLREAKTNPPRPFGTSVPILDPGPDGRLATADDLTFIVAEAKGQAEWVVEGLKEGNHVLEFDIGATADGLSAGPVKLAGTAKGVVLVRDPRFALTFIHPNVVRAGEEYSFRTVITNTSTTPVYNVTLRLPPNLLQGAVLKSGERVEIPELQPGREGVAEFRLEATITGRVTATGFNTSDPLTARFELQVGVGENGIPLSPDSLAFPAYLDALPAQIVKPALSLLGLAHSLATAPPETLNAELPCVAETGVVRRAQELAGHALRASVGEPVNRVIPSLGLAWLATGSADTEFDALRRRSRRNGELFGEVSLALAARAEELGGGAPALSELEELEGAGSPALLVKVKGAGFGRAARLVLSGLSSNRGATGQAADTGFYLRALPYAEVLNLDAPSWQGEIGIIGRWVEEAGYQIQLYGVRVGSVDLEVVRVAADGSTRRWQLTGLATSDCSLLTANVTGSADPVTGLQLNKCTGLAASQQVAVAQDGPPPSPRVVVARQDSSLNATGRNVVLVLSRSAGDLTLFDAAQARVASHLQMGDLVTDRERRGTAVFSQYDRHVVVAALSSPLNPASQMRLSLFGLPMASGAPLDVTDVPVAADNRLRSGAVRGMVIGSDGNPVAGSRVELFESDWRCDAVEGCSWMEGLVDTTGSDSAGWFTFDAVRYRASPAEARVFSVLAVVPGGDQGRASAMLLAPETVQKLDVVLLGRGSVRGYLRTDDGSPLQAPIVQARSVLRPWEGAKAQPAAGGSFVLSGLPVGAVQLFGRDGQDLVYATTNIDRAGAVAEAVLVLSRSRPRPRGQISGTVVSARTTEPRAGIQVFVTPEGAGGPTHRALSGADGSFTVADVPQGNVDLKGYDPAIGRYGFTSTLTVVADRVNAVQAVFNDGAGRVRGVVRQVAQGQATPVPGAIVSTSGTSAWTRTDSSGSYTLEGVPLGPVVVFAQAQPPPAGSGSTGTVAAVLAQDGQEVTLDITLSSRSGSLTGVVLNASGQPVPNVEVSRITHEFAAETRRSGSDGGFLFENLYPGAVRIDATRSQREIGTATGTILYDGQRAETSVRLSSWGNVRLRVEQRTSGGAIVPVKAQLAYRHLESNAGVIGMMRKPAELETDQDGVAVIEAVPDGPLEVEAWTFGAGSTLWRGDLGFPNHETRDLILTLDAFGVVAGMVLDEGGKEPVGSAQVRLVSDPTQVVVSSSEAGHVGEFRFDLVPRGDFQLEVISGARGALYRGSLGEPGQRLEDVRLVLSPLAQEVRGSLSVCGGAASADSAHLVMHSESYSFLPDRVQDRDLSDPSPFVFSGLPGGEWTLRVTTALHGGTRKPFTVHSEGEVVDLGQVCLAPTGRIAGVVTDPRTNAPAERVQVVLLAPWGPYERMLTVGASLTGSDGRFDFTELPLASTYMIQLRDAASGRGASRKGLDVTQNPHSLEMTIALEALGQVYGIVHFAEGGAVGNARVSLDTGSTANLEHHLFLEALATREGAYTFSGVPQGQFVLEARDGVTGLKRRVQGEVRQEGELVRLDVVLPATAHVTGTVRSPNGQAVPAGAGTVTLSQLATGLVAPRAVTSTGNPFTFQGVTTGHYDLQAAAQLERGGAFWLYTGSASAEMPDPPGDQVLDVTLNALANLKVLVRNGGSSLQGALVRVVRRCTDCPAQEMTTQADGAAIFPRLAAATYTVSANYSPPGQTGGLGAVATVAIGQERDATTVEMVLDLEPSGGLRFRPLSPDGSVAIVALATVVHAGRVFQAVGDGAGVVHFPALPAGPYDLEVEDARTPGLFRDSIAITIGQVLDLGDLRLDAVNPTVITTMPPVGASAVPVDTEITVRFSELMRIVSLTPARLSVRYGSGVVNGSLILDPDGTTARFRPSVPLASQTTYAVEVDRAVADLAGRTLGSRFVFSFQTADVLPPRVVSVVPADDPGGTRRAFPDVRPVVTFSEPVGPASVTADGVRLLKGGADLVSGVGLRLERDGFDVRLTPPAGLDPGAIYRVEVTTAVTDPSGNHLASAFTSQFRVASLIPPTVALLPPLGVTVDGDAWRAVEAQGVTLRAAVTSTDPVSNVGFTLNGAPIAGTATLDVGTGEWRMPWTIPRLVQLAGGAALAASAVDISGNRGRSLDHALTVQADAPPTGSIQVSPPAGVVPNHMLTVQLSLQDDRGLASVRVAFAGTLSEQQDVGLSGTSANPSFTARCPATAPSGSEVTVTATVGDSLGQTTTVGPVAVPVLADGTTPQVTKAAPNDGQVVRSGELVSFRFDLQDAVSVSQASLTVGGKDVSISMQNVVLPGEMWTARALASWRAPEVPGAQETPYVFMVGDPAGHQTTVQGSLTVKPLVDPNDPHVGIRCPMSGDWITGGVDVTIAFDVEAVTAANSGNLIQSYRVLVDGQETFAKTDVNQQKLSSTSTWNPPATAAPESTFVVRIEARDYAGNVGFAERTLVVAKGTVLTASQTLTSSLNGQWLVLAKGTFTVTEALNLAGLTVLQGAAVTTQAGRTLNLKAVKTVRVQCGAAIEVNGLGYAGGCQGHMAGRAPDAVAASEPDAGGSHGGPGTVGEKPGTPGEIFDSVLEPSLGGGGGALRFDQNWFGGAGGGVLVLDAATLELEGEVRARGQDRDATATAAGAGGSVVVRAGTVRGAGKIDASGGWYHNDYTAGPSGAGGGGRVAMIVGQFEGFDPRQQVVVRGGAYLEGGSRWMAQRYAGSGTLCLKAPTMTYGELILDQGVTDAMPVSSTPLPAIGAGVIGAAVPDTQDPTSLWIEPQDGTATFVLGVVGMWVRIDGADYRVIAQRDRRHLLLQGGPTVHVGAPYQGVFKLDSLTVKGRASVIFDDLAEVGSVTVEPGSSVAWYNADAPVIDASRVSIGAHDGVFWVAGSPGAATDGNGIASAKLRNLTTTATWPVTLAAGGSFLATSVSGGAGDLIELEATDAHSRPRTTRSVVGALPANAEAPVMTLGPISITAHDSSFWVSGAAGTSATDPDGIRRIELRNVSSGGTWPLTSLPSAFVAKVSGSGGDGIVLAATDLHPQPRSTVVALGTLPVNAGPPQFAADARSRVTFTVASSTTWYMRGPAGVISDPEHPIRLVATNGRTNEQVAIIAAADGSFEVVVGGAAGDSFTLTATDGHPQALSATLAGLAVQGNSPPAVNPGLISITAHDRSFWVAGVAGAITDSDGIGSAAVLNWTKGTSISVTVLPDGSFAATTVTGNAGDEIAIQARDRNAEPRETLVTVGVLAANSGPPAIETARLTLERDCWYLFLRGTTGAVSDANPPILVWVQNQRTGYQFGPVEAESDGSFILGVEGAGGDRFTLTAEDRHPQPLATTANAATLPANRAPAVRTAGIRLKFGQPTGSGGSSAPGASSLQVLPAWEGYFIEFDGGALGDPDNNLLKLEAVDLRSNATWVRTGVCNQSPWTMSLSGGETRKGDSIELRVIDDDELNPLTTTVAIGELPDNPTPPSVQKSFINLLPMGFGFQVVGVAGAVTDSHTPVTVVLTNTTTGKSFPAVTVRSDGSFYTRLEGHVGDTITLVATDGSSNAPVSTAAVTLGTLPDGGVQVEEWPLSGHTITRLSEGFAVLDSGTAGWWIRNPQLADADLYPGLNAAGQLFYNLKLQAPMALDGGSLVGWTEQGSPPIRQARTLQLSTGTLVKAKVRGDEFVIVAEEAAGLKLLRMSAVADASGLWAPDCGEAISSVLLPASAGLHALELLPGPGATVAVLTDDPLAELRLVDVSRPDTSVVGGSVDLPGGVAPTWGVWQTGELFVGRTDGSLEVWRWGDSGPVLFASWRPQQGKVNAAVRRGDQLWVGLDTGDLQQVDIADPAQPLLRGRRSLGEPVVAMDGSLFATTSHLYLAWIPFMPPTIAPDLVTWGYGGGKSWAVLSDPFDYSQEVTVTWSNGQTATGWSTDAMLLTTGTSVQDPPTLVVVSQAGVPSPPYVPANVTLRSFDGSSGPDFAGGVQISREQACLSNRGATGLGSTSDGWLQFVATGIAGQEFCRYTVVDSWAGTSHDTTLSTRGPLLDILTRDSYLVVLDDGVSVWDLDNTRGGNVESPVRTQQLASLQIAPARAAKPLASGSILLAADTPGRYTFLGPLDNSSGTVTVVADNVPLPGFEGLVMDLDSNGDTLFVLSNAGAAGRLYRYSIANPSAPVLELQADVQAGAPAVALAVRGQDSTCDACTSLAAVRRGWGVELCSLELAPLASLPLPGDPRWVTWNSGLYVLLGDFGVARITGPNRSPLVDFVQSNTRPPGKAIRWGGGAIITPEGLTWY